MSDKADLDSGIPGKWFDPGCRRCPRLATFLDEVGADNPGYHARPVPPFGPLDAALLIIGLAPGMHGANRTGRPFTGDFAGLLLYEMLYELGLSNQPTAVARGDGLILEGCRISNAVKCLPPGNKPTGGEVRNCGAWLAAELAASRPRAVLALGRIAHDATLDALGRRRAAHPFAHGAVHNLDGGPVLVDSYHCSRYNTQTRRLTPAMFREALALAAQRAGIGRKR